MQHLSTRWSGWTSRAGVVCAGVLALASPLLGGGRAAAADWTEAVRLNPVHSGAHIKRCETYVQLGQAKEAEAALDEAIRRLRRAFPPQRWRFSRKVRIWSAFSSAPSSGPVQTTARPEVWAVIMYSKARSTLTPSARHSTSTTNRIE